MSLLLLATVASWAASPLSARSKLLLHQRHSSSLTQRAATSDCHSYQAFIELKDSVTIKALRQKGVTVNGRYGNIITATIPEEALATVTSLDGVRHISLASQLTLCNDSARSFSCVNPVHAGAGLVTPLKGKGVIVGVVDTGIDYNHINLCDKDGKTRVCAVYMPCDSTGLSPVLDGDTLPGSCFETPEQIAALTTDNVKSSHGTHTAGTAVGAYHGNPWYGVAPEADVVACGIPSDQLTDVNIANSVKYIFDYADRMGKPCVINMSLSTNEGPNDGTSFLCRVFDAMSGSGRICVLSAGNDGDAPICFHDRIQGVSDTVTTFIRNRSGGLMRKGYVSMWSDASQVHRSRLVVINRSTGVVEYASAVLGELPEDSVYTFSSEEDEVFAEYYEGEVAFVSAMEPQYDDDGNLMDCGRFHSVWEFDVTSQMSGHLLGFQYLADEPVSLAGWCTKEAYFYTFGLDMATGGSPEGSINDLATTSSVISVGAYCSRDTYEGQTGDIFSITDCQPADIASFSSYGPDEKGIMRPDVCAPGQILLSSANRYDEASIRLRWPSAAVVDGVEYPYYSNQGTSMSAPMVTGAIALMLQVNATLTPEDVRAVLARSSRRDDNVSNGNPLRWGSGKLDVAAAVEDVLDNTLLPGDVNNDHEVNIADVMALMDIVIGSTSAFDAATLLRADVNRDQEILVSDINCVIDLILKH
jgi:subtilisin family serine protease